MLDDAIKFNSIKAETINMFFANMDRHLSTGFLSEKLFKDCKTFFIK